MANETAQWTTSDDAQWTDDQWIDDIYLVYVRRYLYFAQRDFYGIFDPRRFYAPFDPREFWNQWANTYDESSVTTYAVNETEWSFSVPGGIYTSGQSLTISGVPDNVTLYYTTDGSTPDNTDTTYTGTINITENTTVKIIGYTDQTGWDPSDVITTTYEFEVDETAWSFSVPGGTYSSEQSLTISGVPDNVTLYYTTDGSAPDETDTTYTGTINIDENTTLKIIGYKDGWTTSDVITTTYEFEVDETAWSPSVPGGTYSAPQSITISDIQNGVTIYYTTDGSTPDETDTAYNGTPISITETTTLKLIGYKGGWGTSDVLSVTYTIVTEAAEPSFDPPGATYNMEQTVTMTTTTPGATIYYTTDGTNPTDEDTEYSGPITIDENTALRAIAYADGYDPSDVHYEYYHLKVLSPTLDPAFGSYGSRQLMTLTPVTDGSTAYHNIGGGFPLSSVSPVAINQTYVVSYRADKVNWGPSDTLSGTYDLSGVGWDSIYDDNDWTKINGMIWFGSYWRTTASPATLQSKNTNNPDSWSYKFEPAKMKISFTRVGGPPYFNNVTITDPNGLTLANVNNYTSGSEINLSYPEGYVCIYRIALTYMGGYFNVTDIQFFVE